MSLADDLREWRSWFPIPKQGRGVEPIRWVLLDGNRLAVSAALLTGVYIAFMLSGTVYTFELRRLLTETPAVQTILSSLLSGIILLVSIVVSINSIVLSHDITSLQDQEDRIGGVLEYRWQIGQLTDSRESPSDPASFLALMTEVLRERAAALEEVSEGSDEEFAQAVKEHAKSINDTIERLGQPVNTDGGAEFGVLWRGLEVEYGPHINRSRRIKSTYGETSSSEFGDRMDDLVEAFKLFATGKEYFKTLYYTQEVSQLSRVLLVVALPAIVITATSILAINAQLLPDVWILGLPPLLSFVATTITISLAPYLVLTSYMLRLSTVARETGTSGPFSLSD